MEQQVTATSHNDNRLSLWVSEKTYAQIHGLNPQTLCNWRYQDHQAGRTEAAPGYPKYRRFGRAVRYWMGD